MTTVLTPTALPSSLPALPPARGDVLLRPFTESDEAALLRVAQDPEMLRWMALSAPLLTQKDVRAWILDAHERAHERTGLRVAVCAPDDGTLLGCVELQLFSSGSGAVGYWTLPEQRRRGIARQALRLLCDYAFTHDLAWALDLLTLPGNTASEGVASACGFVPDGQFARYEPRVEREVTFNVFTRERY